jgi:hypothetical protein
MLSGVHELLHLVDCTIDFGPLNGINLFQYEEDNRKLIKYINGMDLIGEELIKLYSTAHFLTSYANNVKNPDLKNFIISRIGFKSSNNKKLEPKDLQYALKSKPEVVHNEKILVTLRNYPMNLNFDLIKGYTIVLTSIHNKTKRCDSCFISMTSKKIGLIENFVYDSEKCLVVARQLIEIFNPFFSSVCPDLRSRSTICVKSENFFVAELKDIKKLFFTELNGNDILISNFCVSHLFN